MKSNILLRVASWGQGYQLSDEWRNTHLCGRQDGPASHLLPKWTPEVWGLLFLSRGSKFTSPRSPGSHSIPAFLSHSKWVTIQVGAKFCPQWGHSVQPLGSISNAEPRQTQSLAWRQQILGCLSSCGWSRTTNSLTEWQQLYWQANSIKGPASNNVSGSPLCIKNVESCLHFPECPQP